MAEYIDEEKAYEILNEDYAYAAAKLLDEVPIADVAEVRHGEWIDKGQEDDSYENCYECSACHNWIFMVDEEYNYCPNCGAKMDKE